jgi:hypothetical protein
LRAGRDARRGRRAWRCAGAGVEGVELQRSGEVAGFDDLIVEHRLSTGGKQATVMQIKHTLNGQRSDPAFKRPVAEAAAHIRAGGDPAMRCRIVAAQSGFLPRDECGAWARQPAADQSLVTAHSSSGDEDPLQSPTARDMRCQSREIIRYGAIRRAVRRGSPTRMMASKRPSRRRSTQPGSAAASISPATRSPMPARAAAGVVPAFIATVFAQETADAASVQWRKVADQLRPTVPKLATFKDTSEEEVLAYMTYPPQYVPSCTRPAHRAAQRRDQTTHQCCRYLPQRGCPLHGAGKYRAAER